MKQSVDHARNRAIAAANVLPAGLRPLYPPMCRYTDQSRCQMSVNVSHWMHPCVPCADSVLSAPHARIETVATQRDASDRRATSRGCLCSCRPRLPACATCGRRGTQGQIAVVAVYKRLRGPGGTTRVVRLVSHPARSSNECSGTCCICVESLVTVCPQSDSWPRLERLCRCLLFITLFQVLSRALRKRAGGKLVHDQPQHVNRKWKIVGSKQLTRV